MAPCIRKWSTVFLNDIDHGLLSKRLTTIIDHVTGIMTYLLYTKKHELRQVQNGIPLNEYCHLTAHQRVHLVKEASVRAHVLW